jgi:hypothetical protein
MTPETKHPPAGYVRRPRLSPGGADFPHGGQLPPVPPGPTDMRSPVRDTDAPVRSAEAVRSVEVVGEAVRTGQRDAAVDGSIVGVIPYLAVLVCTIAGVYVAWHQGSAGGGKGGVVGGVALLVAAIVRLVVPARLVGLLGTRNRVIDVLTLAIFGGGLLVAGLVLPH